MTKSWYRALVSALKFWYLFATSPSGSGMETSVYPNETFWQVKREDLKRQWKRMIFFVCVIFFFFLFKQNLTDMYSVIMVDFFWVQNDKTYGYTILFFILLKALLLCLLYITVSLQKGYGASPSAWTVHAVLLGTSKFSRKNQHWKTITTLELFIN
jgi:hypothetical protein